MDLLLSLLWKMASSKIFYYWMIIQTIIILFHAKKYNFSATYFGVLIYHILFVVVLHFILQYNAASL